MPKTEKFDPIDVYIGNRLRQKRKLLGLSQDDFGKALNPVKTFQQVQKYERGETRLPFSVVYQAIKILNVDIDYFTDGLEAHLANIEHIVGDPVISNEASIMLNDAKTRKLAMHFAHIPNEAMRDNILLFTKNTANEFKPKEGEANGK